MFSAWFGALGPALLGVVLSALVFYYSFLPPIYSLASKPVQIPRFMIFLVSASFVGFLSVAQRRVAESLRRARDRLNETVQELRKTNEALGKSEAYLADAQRSAKPAVLGGALRAESSSGPRRPFGYLDTIGHSNRPFNRLSNGFIRIVQEAFDSASHGKDLDLEHRLLTPDGSIKVHVLGHALTRERAKPGFVGAVMDITTMKNAMEEIQALRASCRKRT